MDLWFGKGGGFIAFGYMNGASWASRSTSKRRAGAGAPRYKVTSVGVAFWIQ